MSRKDFGTLLLVFDWGASFLFTRKPMLCHVPAGIQEIAAATTDSEGRFDIRV
ncbi:hypothetical protein D3C73_562200 [compost metagenome]